jgi:hypothetical protein
MAGRRPVEGFMEEGVDSVSKYFHCGNINYNPVLSKTVLNSKKPVFHINSNISNDLVLCQTLN